jgi:hypothetical protein
VVPVTDGFAALDEHLARVRALPGLVTRAVPAVRDAVRAELRASIARGESPDGEKWAPTKTGKQALANAGNALSISSVGTTVVASLSGPEALHNNGWVRGGVARPILPKSGTLPTRLGRAVGEAIADEFRRTMGGAR